MNKKPISFSELPTITGNGIVLRALSDDDAPALKELTEDNEVYRFLPKYLFEKRYPDTREVIRRLYDEGLRESLILGIIADGEFCGLAEMYGYIEELREISVGNRLIKHFWGRCIATKALGLMVNYLLNETDIEIITASTMIENKASTAVLRKNGFTLVDSELPEDWGFDAPVLTDKWIKRVSENSMSSL